MTYEIKAPYRPFTPHVNALTIDAGTVLLDMARIDQRYMTVTLTGATTFETDNISEGRTLLVKLTAGASDRALTFPSWIFLGGTPTTLVANDTAILKVRWFDNTDAAAVAEWTPLTSSSSSASWVTVTPTFGGLTKGTGSSTNGEYLATDGGFRYRGYLTFGTGGTVTGSATLNLPNSYTVRDLDSSNLYRVGRVSYFYDALTGFDTIGSLRATSGNTYVDFMFAEDDTSSVRERQITSSAPASVTSGDYWAWDAFIPT